MTADLIVENQIFSDTEQCSIRNLLGVGRGAFREQICSAFPLIRERDECACNLTLAPHLLTRQNSKDVELKLSS